MTLGAGRDSKWKPQHRQWGGHVQIWDAVHLDTAGMVPMEAGSFGLEGDMNWSILKSLKCDMGSLPFRYLGILTHHRKLCNSYWKEI